MLIHTYTQEWVEHFRAIKNEIEQALTGLNIKIEHVGSTSVPGLAAKPIIDIDVEYQPDVNFEEINTKLAGIGYYHNGDQGIVNREAFRRKDFTSQHTILDNIAHHLYVCPHYSEELHRHLLFRDYLRANETARIEYQELKQTLAREANQHKKTYVDLKEVKARKFIESIIEKAKNTQP